jgi:D-beta-D-heptose 7-phosphate kinase/D-beta-D-heptose 1-phosphate adenosyltransferase
MIEHLSELTREIEHIWASKRLLVIGDVMLDKYVFGEVGRISPEAPVPVVRSTHQTIQPGGAANVAMNLSRLGAQTHLVGFAGNDEDQAQLERCLRSNGISSSFVSSEGFPTITKQRILGGWQQMLRLDNERLDVRPKDDYDRLIGRALEGLSGFDAVVLSDYAKGVLTEEVCQQVICAARSRGIPVLVDPKNADFLRYRGATTICPNIRELSIAARLESRDLKTLFDVAESMIPTLEIGFFTVTMSERGIALVRPGQRFIAPAVARQVFDVSGAGDTVVAVLALCLASKVETSAAMELANLAAGIVVAKVGTVPVEKHELLAALSPQMALNAADKVVALPELLVRIAQWKAHSERIVFTNGCFDLLHVGHLTVLEEARRFGDRLIVAINSDASVRALKGPSRPIVSEAERGRVLAALAAVDAVVVFDDPTPLELVLATRPDVIVKGGDYDVTTVVGAQEVLSWGGQVKLVPVVEGRSTSRLIDKSRA